MKAIKFIIAAAVATAAVACTGKFEEINKNPNNLTVGQVKSYNCIEPIIYSLGRNFQYDGMYFVNELCQVTAATNSGTRQEHMYNITASNHQGVWDKYVRSAFDCTHMMSLAEQEHDDFYKGVGLILKSICFEQVCSIYGDMPFHEAFQGSSNLTPAFESQEEVFKGIIVDLDSANVILAKNPKPLVGGFDAIYGDNAGKWRKFANSLRLRLLCRMGGIDSKYWSEMQAVINDPETYPVFASNADNATLTFQAVDPYKSYFGTGTSITSAGSRIEKNDITMRRLTQSFVKVTVIQNDKFETLFKDPRLDIWGVSGGDDKWIGTVAGCTEAEKKEAEKQKLCVPNYNTLAAEDQPGWWMDYSEILFIFAEGVNSGLLTMPKTAKEYYEAAVTASIEKWAPFVKFNSKPKTIKATDVTNFLASGLASWDLASTADETSVSKSTEELIATQKWLSLLYVPWQMYHEWRRTEYPHVIIGNGTNYNQYELPTRFLYPAYTCSTNPKNVEAALQRMGASANDMHGWLDWSYAKHHDGHRDPYTEHSAL
ncbi:MAG: SusD/RagB family nutrient-binding outer membrane lipoprotein [Bacteroidales bacterium]|nr:SusD/RagB family nutrient-binding outer membrane lipoprotein [Bacteroidales bacterium]